MGRRRGFGFGRQKKSLLDQVRDIDATFAEEVYSLKDETLDAKLATMAKYRAETEDIQKKDTDIIAAKENLRELNKSYNEIIKGVKLKTKLIVSVLKDRGRDVGGPGTKIDTTNKGPVAATPTTVVADASAGTGPKQ